MKGLLGYGRYDDDKDCIGCPRAKSDMTPCIARDGSTAQTDDGHCVGCSHSAAALLKEAVTVLSMHNPGTRVDGLRAALEVVENIEPRPQGWLDEEVHGRFLDAIRALIAEEEGKNEG